MSGNRTKPKPINARNRRGTSNFVGKFGNSNSSQLREDNFLNNADSTYTLCHFYLGNVVEITTAEDRLINGLLRAISPAGDVCMSHASITDRGNGASNGAHYKDNLTVPIKDVKRMVTRDTKPDDCVKQELLTDAEITRRTTVAAKNDGDGVELQDYFKEGEIIQADFLDANKEGDHWFPPEAMFRTNHERFNVQSSYNETLTGYTCGIDKSGDFDARNARAERLAKEIERDTHSKRAANLENDCGDVGDATAADEEALFASVVRPNNNYRQADQLPRRLGHPPETERAKAFRNAFRPAPPPKLLDSGGGDPGAAKVVGASNSTPAVAPGSSVTPPSQISSSEVSYGPTRTSREDSPTAPLEAGALTTPAQQDDLRDPEAAPTETAVILPESTAITENSTSAPAQSQTAAPGSEAEKPSGETKKSTMLNPDAPEFKPRFLPSNSSSNTAQSVAARPSVGFLTNGSAVMANNAGMIHHQQQHQNSMPPPLVPPAGAVSGLPMGQQTMRYHSGPSNMPFANQMVYHQTQLMHPNHPHQTLQMVAASNPHQMRSGVPPQAGGNGKPGRAVVNVNQPSGGVQNQGVSQVHQQQSQVQQTMSQQQQQQQQGQHPPSLSSPHQANTLYQRQRSNEAAAAAQVYAGHPLLMCSMPPHMQASLHPAHQNQSQNVLYNAAQSGLFQSYPPGAQGMANRSTPPNAAMSGQQGPPPQGPHMVAGQHQGQAPPPPQVSTPQQVFQAHSQPTSHQQALHQVSQAAGYPSGIYPLASAQPHSQTPYFFQSSGGQQHGMVYNPLPAQMTMAAGQNQQQIPPPPSAHNQNQPTQAGGGGQHQTAHHSFLLQQSHHPQAAQPGHTSSTAGPHFVSPPMLHHQHPGQQVMLQAGGQGGQGHHPMQPAPPQPPQAQHFQHQLQAGPAPQHQQMLYAGYYPRHLQQPQ